MVNAGLIENFPGFPEGIAGPEFFALLQRQALDAGVRFVPARAERIEDVDGTFNVATAVGDTWARCVIVCVGSAIRELGVEGETYFRGRGISHCATCDGPLFRGRRVAVVGGGDAALDSALHVSSLASSVTIIHRGLALTGQRTLQDRLESRENIDVLLETVVLGFEGSDALESLIIRHAGADVRLAIDGVFVFAGLKPNTQFLSNLVDLDGGHVITDQWLATSMPGIFAAGDIRMCSARQFVAAAGDGATAAIAAHSFLETATRLRQRL